MGPGDGVVRRREPAQDRRDEIADARVDATFVEGVATAGFELLIGGLTAWVVDAVLWVVGGVFNFFLDSTDPNVQADWFVTGTGPYATTVSIGAGLLLLFVLAGIVQGTLNGDAGDDTLVWNNGDATDVTATFEPGV